MSCFSFSARDQIRPAEIWLHVLGGRRDLHPGGGAGAGELDIRGPAGQRGRRGGEEPIRVRTTLTQSEKLSPIGGFAFFLKLTFRMGKDMQPPMRLNSSLCIAVR